MERNVSSKQFHLRKTWSEICVRNIRTDWESSDDWRTVCMCVWACVRLTQPLTTTTLLTPITTGNPLTTLNNTTNVIITTITAPVTAHYDNNKNTSTNNNTTNNKKHKKTTENPITTLNNTTNIIITDVDSNEVFLLSFKSTFQVFFFINLYFPKFQSITFYFYLYYISC